MEEAKPELPLLALSGFDLALEIQGKHSAWCLLCGEYRAQVPFILLPSEGPELDSEHSLHLPATSTLHRPAAH